MNPETLLTSGLQSAVLFLVIWAVFRIVPSLPANSKAWIWRFAFLKPVLCLLPFAAVPLRLLPAPTVQTAQSALEAHSEVIVLAPPVNVAAESHPIDLVLLAWTIGASLVALYGICGWIRVVRIAAAATYVVDPRVHSLLRDLTARAGVTRPIRLVASPSVEGAVLMSGFRPTIVLPASALDAESTQDLRLMLAHEVAHIARRDLGWFGFVAVVQALFFFNPFVWLAARCSRLDHESATDQYAAELASVEIQTYADMLLRATVVARTSLAPGILAMSESYRTIHRRLEAMKHFNSQPSNWRKASIGALALATIGLIPLYQLAQAAPVPPQTGQAKSLPKTEATTKKAAKSTKTKKSSVTVKAVNAKPAAAKAQALKATNVSGSFIKSVNTTRGGSLLKGENIRSGKGATLTGTLNPGSTNVQTSDSLGVSVNGEAKSSVSGGSNSGQSTSVSGSISTSQSGGSQNSGSATGISVSTGTSANASGSATGLTSGQGSGSFTRTVNGKTETINSGSGQSWSTQSSWNTSGSTSTTSPSGSSRRSSSIGMTSNDGNRLVTMEFHNVNVREAIAVVFKMVPYSFKIDTDVQGTINLSLRNVSLDTALKNMLKQVGGSFKMEDGLYHFVANP